MGFEKLDRSGKRLVCRLNNSVFGLRQATTNLYEQLAIFLIEQIFVRGKYDYSLFRKKNDKRTFLAKLGWWRSPHWKHFQDKEDIKRPLETNFNMYDRIKLECCLGMQNSEDSNDVTND